MQIATINSQPTMSSLELVQFINNQRKVDEPELRHDHFMAKVVKVLGEEAAPKFRGSYTGADNTIRPCYQLPKREACLMAMSYSYDLQAKVYDRMTELEAKQAPALPNFLDPAEAAMAWATEYKAKQAAQLQIAHMKPFADFGEAVSASATDVLIGDWIKAINDGGLRIGRNKAFQWFRSKGYLGDRNIPMQKYIDQGLFKVKEGLINLPTGQRATFTTMLTGKGQVYFAAKMGKSAKGV
jgi:phage antirepressor YoqD-like protein